MRFEITENKPLTDAVWDLRLTGDTGAISRPGQFVQVALPGSPPPQAACSRPRRAPDG